MQTLRCCIVLGFPCLFHVFTIPRHIGDRGRVLSTVPAPRSPSLALGPVLSPVTPRAAVWGGRGTVARPRAVAWRLGEPFQNGAFYIPLYLLHCTYCNTDSDVKIQNLRRRS